MFGRSVCVIAAVASMVIACSGGDGNSNEGGSCSKADDCGGNLTCQPITGRTGDYCCPTPASSSDQTNCHATQ